MSTALQRAIFWVGLTLAAATATAHAQMQDDHHGGRHVRGSGFASGGSIPVHNLPPGSRPNAPALNSTMRGGLQLGPPGRWWDDKDFAKSLGLRKDQQKRMDSVFDANKGAILDSYVALQKQEAVLEATSKEAKLDEGRIFAAIDGVNQARCALEKANAHMLLMVRQEMDQDQVARMEKIRDKPADE